MDYSRTQEERLKRFIKKTFLLIGLTLLLGKSGMAQHWIIFQAFPSDPLGLGTTKSIAGHAYVSFVIRDEVKKQTFVEETWGFNPVKTSLKALVSIESEMHYTFGLDDIGPKHEYSARDAKYDFVVEVNEDVYRKCKNVKDIWQKKNYSIIAAQTCVQYAADVARVIPGVVLPNDLFDRLPQSFLTDLRNSNKDIDAEGRRSLSEVPAAAVMKTYLSPDGLFQFSYPEHWEQYPGDISSSGIMAQFDAPNASTNRWSKVLIVVAKNSYDLSRLKSDIQKEILSENKPKIIRLENKKLGNYPGVFSEYLESATDTTLTMEWTVVKGSQAITLFYQTTDKANEAEGLAIVNSFSLPAMPKTAKPSAKFFINPRDVTLPSDKNFKWYDWEKAPADFKVAAKFLMTYEDRSTGKYISLFEKITNYLHDECKVKIAAVDLDEDGVCGLAIAAEGRSCCGTLGCTFELYENGGLRQSDIADDFRNLKPGKDGIRLISNGKLIPLIDNVAVSVDEDETLRLFTYTRIPKPAPASSALIGGKTPEELGRVLLKALQTDNGQLWEKCVHPLTDQRKYANEGDRQKLVDRFEAIKDFFAERGLSDWKGVVLSRVTFEKCNQCAPAGETWLSEMTIEFTYKQKEFLGSLSFTPVWTYQGKYFISGFYTDKTFFIRNTNRN